MMDQKNVTLVVSIAVATLIAGCITVHIYFPAKALREAADQIVEEVRPEIASTDEAGSEAGEGGNDTAPEDGDDLDPSSAEDDARAAIRRGDRSLARRALLAAFYTRTAWAVEEEEQEKEQAEEESDDDEVEDENERRLIKASSPKIVKIKASLKSRYKLLLPLYVAGRIGEGLDGYLAIREVEGLSLKERRDVLTLLKAENGDRKNLYEAIARENNIADDKIKDIGRIFSRAWQKSSKTGWWIEVIEEKKKKWVKKPKPKKSTKPSSDESENAA